MITINIRTTSERKTVVVAPTTTVASVLSDNGIDTAGKVFQINGTSLQASELGKTFADFGGTSGSTMMLSAVVKADSAN